MDAELQDAADAQGEGGRLPVYMRPSQYFSVTADQQVPEGSGQVHRLFHQRRRGQQDPGRRARRPHQHQGAGGAEARGRKAAADSFDLIERAAAYAQKTPPNDPPGWTTILTKILEPRTIPGIMYKAWTAVEGTANFRREANLVLMGGMVPDGGTPDVPSIPDGGGAMRRPGGAVDGALDGGAPRTWRRRRHATMSFFVTSTGSGAMGGNLGGLAGADARCEMLAAAVGAGGKGWRAYLSTEMAAVNAKDRIGTRAFDRPRTRPPTAAEPSRPATMFANTHGRPPRERRSSR